MTITLPADIAATIKGAIEDGDYPSDTAVVREALLDWTTKRAIQAHEFATLKAEIGLATADHAAGRVQDFDAERIIERGRSLLSNHAGSD